MSASVLPNEVLEVIFKNLKGTDILKCRRVCQRWKSIVDNFKERYWMETCQKEHSDVYMEAYRKASLSWKDLYKPLTLWSKVSNAEVNINETPGKITRIFQMLQNGVLAYPQRVKGTCPIDRYDTIIYYNLITEEEIHRESFDSFVLYKENDYIIVLDSFYNDSIRVVPKSDKQVWHCANVRMLLENEICTQIRNILTCVKFVETNNGVILEMEDIADFNHDIKEFTLIDSNRTNIFTSDGLILSRIGKKIKLITSYDTISNNSSTTFEVAERLKELGFSWCSPPIFKHLHSRIRSIGPYMLDTMYAYGNILIIGRCTPSHRKIHIYCNPFNSDGELGIFDKAPDKTIDLNINKGMTPTSWHRDIKQIDVVEIENGHKIVVLFCDSIYVVNLTHGAVKKGNMNRPSRLTCSVA